MFGTNPPYYSINFRNAIDAAHADGRFDWKYDSYHMDRMWRFLYISPVERIAHRAKFT